MRRALVPPVTGEPRARLIAVAHAAGNDRVLLRRAVASAVDFVEADLWPSRDGGIVARHERRLGPLPLLYDKWYLKLDVRPVRLDAMMQAAAGRTRVFADIKSSRPGFVGRVIDALERGGALQGAALCGQYWTQLVSAPAPSDVLILPSIADEAGLQRFWAFLDGKGSRVHGVCIRHWLLTPEVVAALRQRDLLIVAWTVDSERRARDLMEMAVDGLISNSLPLLSHAVAGAEPARRPTRPD